MMQSHFQGPLLGCFEYVPYTALTIVCTINVSIDCKKNKVSNPNERKNILDRESKQQVAWFVFCFKIKLCAKMMFSLLLRQQIVKFFVPGCAGQLHQMGLIVVTIKHCLFVLQQPILIGWD